MTTPDSTPSGSLAANTSAEVPSIGENLAEQGQLPHHDLPEDHTTELDHDDDGDSACGSLLDDDTQTLNSLVTAYRYENSRRYHSYGDTPYWGPNDEDASSQQDFAHHMYTMTLDGKLHLAPISNPHRVLDVGTGTGIWAMDMADLYPNTFVTGTDLSPIQPAFVPPNCIFEIDDFNREWTYPENHFDFIHVRELFGSVIDWDELFQKIMRHTTPGGWVEVVEHSVCPRSEDDTVGPDHFYTYWGKLALEAGDKWNKTFRIWEESKERMIRAGFENVTEVRYKWPMNHWPKDPHMKQLGRWNQCRLYEGVESYALRLLTAALGWSYEQAQLLIAKYRHELKDKSTHAFLDVSVVYGQKPKN